MQILLYSINSEFYTSLFVPRLIWRRYRYWRTTVAIHCVATSTAVSPSGLSTRDGHFLSCRTVHQEPRHGLADGLAACGRVRETIV